MKEGERWDVLYCAGRVTLLALSGKQEDTAKSSLRSAFFGLLRPTLRQMPFIGRFAPSNKHLSSLALLKRRVIWPCDGDLLCETSFDLHNLSSCSVSFTPHQSS